MQQYYKDAQQSSVCMETFKCNPNIKSKKADMKKQAAHIGLILQRVQAKAEKAYMRFDEKKFQEEYRRMFIKLLSYKMRLCERATELKSND